LSAIGASTRAFDPNKPLITWKVSSFDGSKEYLFKVADDAIAAWEGFFAKHGVR